MTPEKIKETIQKEVETLIKSAYDKDVEVKMSDKLEEDLGLDSLDKVELWINMESKYKVNIPETEIGNVKTVNDIVKIVQKYLKRKNNKDFT